MIFIMPKGGTEPNFVTGQTQPYNVKNGVIYYTADELHARNRNTAFLLGGGIALGILVIALGRSGAGTTDKRPEQ
jgi:hypothetical protein